MKNLMIYVNPTRGFSGNGFRNEADALAKIQIDNSLELGWGLDEIMLVTNFEYEHGGVRATVVPDSLFCRHSPTATKVYVIIHLFESGLISDELHWFHDLDAFQLAWITEEELGLENHDIGITDYGRSSINSGRDLRWSTGTIFFKPSALDIFRLWQREVELYQVNEEIALLEMLKKKKYRAARERIKKVNITYNLATRKRKVGETYAMADKPLRVVHFHPFDDRAVSQGHTNIDVCLYGKGEIGHPLVTDRLREVFGRYGIS